MTDQPELARPTESTWGWETFYPTQRERGAMPTDGTINEPFWGYPTCTYPTREKALEADNSWTRGRYWPSGLPIRRRLVRITATRTVEVVLNGSEEGQS